MRILDENTDKSIEQIIIYLTKTEAVQMKSDLDRLIKEPNLHHVHLSSDDYQKEITICIYDSERLENFDERSKKLILEDI